MRAIDTLKSTRPPAWRRAWQLVRLAEDHGVRLTFVEAFGLVVDEMTRR